MVNKGKVWLLKIGTDVITSSQKGVNVQLMKEIGQVMAEEQYVVVSSGAVACGRQLIPTLGHNITHKRVAAAFGQPLLMTHWAQALQPKNVAQVMVTQRDLKDPHARKCLIEVLEVAFSTYNVPIINGNDVITDEELKEMRGEFDDNDTIALLLADVLYEKDYDVSVVFLTNAPGIMDEYRDTFAIMKISQFSAHNFKRMDWGKSEGGTGGITSKLLKIQQFLNKHRNATVFVINGKDPALLKNIVKNNTLTPTQIVW